MIRVSLTVNGQIVEASVSQQETLLSFLRLRLGLKGAKRGCDNGECGSCTVIVDGKARRSCHLRVSTLNGSSVQTIESLSSGEELHPVQEAFLLAGAVQCGFCTPGMIMSIKALLDHNPQPNETEIRQALRHNLCRCTGYVKTIEAVRLATGFLAGKAPACRSPMLGSVGEACLDIDGQAKVTGRLPFADDLTVDGVLTGRVIFAEVPHAKITGIDTSAARRVPGVVDILTFRDVPGVNGIGFAKQDQPVLASDRIRSVGDAVALVLADRSEAAEIACQAVQVSYEKIPVVTSPDIGIVPGAFELYPSGNICQEFHLDRGGLAKAMASASVVLTGHFTTPFVEHAYLEPESAIAEVNSEGKLTIRTCTQYPFEVRDQLAAILNIRPENITVVATSIGGGFGGKTDMAPCIALAALGAWHTRRQVKITLSRSESIRSSTKKHASSMDYTIGFDERGHISAVEAELLFDVGPYTGQSDGLVEQACIFSCGPYRVPHLKVRGRGIYTNNGNGGAMRGFGINQPAFAIESMLDEAARKLRIDPLELRSRNILRAGDQTIAGETLGHCEAEIVLETMQTHIKARSEQGLPRGWHRGYGVALAYKNVGWGRGAADDGVAVISLETDGKIHVVSSGVEMGQGIKTTLGMLLGRFLPIDNVSVECEQLNTSRVHSHNGAAGQRQTFCTGNAMMAAAAKFRERLIGAIEQHHGLEQVQLERITNCRAYLRNQAHPVIELRELAAKLAIDNEFIRAEEIYIAPQTYSLSEGGKIEKSAYRHYPTYAYTGCQATVLINPEKNMVKVEKLKVFQDVGKALNPLSIEGQLEGSCMMALGYTLSEEYRLENGQPVSLTLTGMGVPTIDDVPEIECILIEALDPDGPMGAKGMSEVATVAVTPAIANAIRDAGGERVYDLPVRGRRKS